MHRKILAFISVLAAGMLAGQTQPQPSAPKPTPQAKAFKAPQTSWGDPDLEGLWPGSVNIPLQRPANMGTRSTLTEEEFAARDAAEKRESPTAIGSSIIPQATKLLWLWILPTDESLP